MLLRMFEVCGRKFKSLKLTNKCDFMTLMTERKYCAKSLKSPELDAVLQVRPHQCQVERKDHCPWPTSSALPNAARMLYLEGCLAVYSAYLLRVYSAPSSKSLMKLLDSIDPRGSCFPLNFDQLITSFWAWLFSQFSLDLTVYFGLERNWIRD